MGRIPEDAMHWDSGDWIEWHRRPVGVDVSTFSSAAQETTAHLTALHVSLLHAARGYYELTGQHLPVYHEIAQVYATLYFNLPLKDAAPSDNHTDVKIMYLPPHGPDNIVEVDLGKSFNSLVVVRITDNFTCEARFVQRNALPQDATGVLKLRWQSLPEHV